MRVVHAASRHTHMPRGGWMKRQEPEQPNIVKTLQIGNATVHIADNFCARTPEEIDKVLNEYHAAGWAIVDELVERGEEV